MTTTEHYALNIVEGKDYVNPLTQQNPNFTKTDTAMWENKLNGTHPATELLTGTVHAITREFSQSAMFRFIATSNYTYGDTFTVNGVAIGAELPDGTALPTNAFRVGSNVLCIQSGNVLTIITNAVKDIELSGYMKTADYVGATASGSVNTAVNATNATTAQNAISLGNVPAANYALKANLDPMIQNVTAIKVVAALPADAASYPTTLFLVKEA